MVRELRFGMRGGRVVEVDADATREAYARETGGRDCTCAECRNLRAQLGAFVPEAVRRSLAEAGVDWTKPGAIMSLGAETGPGVGGARMMYEVMYAAIGREVGHGDDRDLGPTWLQVEGGAGPAGLTGVEAPQVRLSFVAIDVPWVLDGAP